MGVDERSRGGRQPAELPAKWWRELLYIVAFYLVYSFIRNLFGSAAVSPRLAYENAQRIIDLEEAIGTYIEPTVQGWFLDNPTVMRAWNIHYGTLHFWVTGGALIAAYRLLPTAYRRIRNTLAIMTGSALIGFATFPLMPPRLLDASGEFGGATLTTRDYGYVDSLAEFGGLWSFDSGTVASISNQYAAMPSLHTGWSLWVVVALWPLARTWWQRAIVIAHPTATVFGIVVTANHYWIDGLGGALVLGIGILGARWATPWWEQRSLAAHARRANRSSES
jgi:hypothetical protein